MSDGVPSGNTALTSYLPGSIVTPRRRRDSVGVIILGLGLADVLAVRRFAALGYVAMQMRLIRDAEHHRDVQRRHQTYDTSGVERCRSAMDQLTAEHGVDRFILVGNCALANICFNTARADPRVIGLVCSNPHAPDPQLNTLAFRLHRRLFGRGSWLRRRRAGTDAGAPPRLTAPASQPDDVNANAVLKWQFDGDIVLRTDFDRSLSELVSSRALPVLIVFSDVEPSLHYFEMKFRRTLDALVRQKKLSFQILGADVHDFSATAEAARAFNDVVSSWMERVVLPTMPAASSPPATEAAGLGTSARG
jgi:hypothetical protein